jgi:hypothetical protein
MKIVISTIVLSIAAALALVGIAQAADSLGPDLDPRTRAKIAKAKAKAAAQEAESFDFLNNGNGNAKTECGAQAIGNIDLNRQAGVGPREIFIFAPNAINVVGPRGCQ